MRPWYVIFAFVIGFSNFSFALTNSCSQFYNPVKRSRASAFAHAVASSISSRAPDQQQMRGYAILVGTMVGSAALSTYLTAELPKSMTFLSQLVSQVGTIGIYVFGAPIWEPISSKFRKIAFGLKDSAADAVTDTWMERLWQRTQQTYSLNAQMSRNVVNSLLLAVQTQFHQARIAINSGDINLVSDLMAESAIRMRQLFAEVEPENHSVALAVQSSFTRHIENKSELKELIWQKIKEFDDDAESNTTKQYYKTLLDTWFKH